MTLRVRCFAKINTVLLVRGRRSDGFHELDTEFVSLDLADVLDVERADSGFELRVEGATADEVPLAGNLVLRAARALQDEVGAAELPGARFVLHKRIPAAAGLGGGSSDAAGTIEGLARLHGLDVPTGRLEALALDLGSDVPFFLRGGRQRGRGRGEILEALPARPDVPVVLLNPRFPLSTADVFREHARWQREHPDARPRGVLTKRKIGRTLNLESWWTEPTFFLHDDLADAALRLAPGLAGLAEEAERVFPDGQVGMTGSGPTLVVLLPGGADAEGRLQGLLPRAAGWLTRTIGEDEYRARRFS